MHKNYRQSLSLRLFRTTAARATQQDRRRPGGKGKLYGGRARSIYFLCFDLSNSISVRSGYYKNRHPDILGLENAVRCVRERKRRRRIDTKPSTVVVGYYSARSIGESNFDFLFVVKKIGVSLRSFFLNFLLFYCAISLSIPFKASYLLKLRSGTRNRYKFVCRG